MSRTIRRTQFNKKKRFFQHYWEAFSRKEVVAGNYIDLWQYHGDNYYTKSCKDNKQFFKNLEDRNLRREFKKSVNTCIDLENFNLKKVKAQSIKWKIH